MTLASLNGQLSASASPASTAAEEMPVAVGIGLVDRVQTRLMKPNTDLVTAWVVVVPVLVGDLARHDWPASGDRSLVGRRNDLRALRQLDCHIDQRLVLRRSPQPGERHRPVLGREVLEGVNADDPVVLSIEGQRLQPGAVDPDV